MNDGEQTASNVLQAARALIEQGWCQGANSQHGCYCLVGAIWRAAYVTPGVANRARAESLLYDALPQSYRQSAHPESMLIHYNDSPGRTKDQVLALFDTALERVRK